MEFSINSLKKKVTEHHRQISDCSPRSFHTQLMEPLKPKRADDDPDQDFALFEKNFGHVLCTEEL